MKNIFKLIVAAIISVLFVPGLFAQTDSLVKFDGIDVSLSYKQDFIKKDMKTGSKYVTYEENEIYGINSVILKNDILQIPRENKTFKIDNVEKIRINTGKKYVGSILIGTGIGLVCGLVAGTVIQYNGHKYFFSTDRHPEAGIISVGIVALGAFLGFLAAPSDYEEVSLKYYNAERKKDIMIKSFNKSKMQNF